MPTNNSKKIIAQHYKNKNQEYLERRGGEVMQVPFTCTQEMNDELLVHDVRKEETHLLSAKSKEAFELAESCETVGELVEKLEVELEREQAHAILGELVDKELVIVKRDLASRRGFLKAAAVAVPLITTLAMSSPAAAQSFPLPLPSGGTGICSCGVECAEFGGESICVQLAGPANYEICFNPAGCEPITTCVANGADFLACVDSCGPGQDMAFCKFCAPGGQCGASTPPQYTSACGCTAP